MHIMRALVRIHRFQIRRMPHHMEIGRNAVAAMHVPRDTGDIQRLATVISFYREIISGTIRPASNRRPTRKAA